MGKPAWVLERPKQFSDRGNQGQRYDHGKRPAVFRGRVNPVRQRELLQRERLLHPVIGNVLASNY